MRTTAQRAATAVLVALLLGAAASASDASRAIGTRPQGRLTLSSARLVFEAGEGFLVVSCPVTLEGSLYGATQKITGALAGELTRNVIAERSCSGGARVLTELLPWSIQYVSFAGTLPNIASVTYRIEPIEFMVTALGVECLYGGALRGTTVGGAEVRELRLDETVRVPFVSGSRLCPTSGHVSGTLRFGSTVRLTLLETVAFGSIVTTNPTPELVIPAANNNGTFRLEASPQGGSTVTSVVVRADRANPPLSTFNTSGCPGATFIATSGSCTVTVTPIAGGRPTRGTVIIEYLNNMNIARPAGHHVRSE